MDLIKISIISHGALGLGIVAMIWTIGRTMCKLCSIKDDWHKYYWYTFGLLVLTALSFVSLILPREVVLCALAITLIRLIYNQERQKILEINLYKLSMVEYGVWVLYVLITIGFSLILGLRFHGPTVNLPSSVYGDLVTYVSFMSSYLVDPILLPDLLVEGIRLTGYANGATQVIGAGLLNFDLIDPFLFLIVTVPVIGLTTLGIQISDHLSKSSRFSYVFAPLYSILVICSIPYIGYIVESPPVMLALPIIFTIYGFVNFCKIELGFREVMLGIVILFALYITKVTVLLLLIAAVPYVYQNAPRMIIILVVAIGLISGLLLLWKYSWVVSEMSFEFIPIRILEERGYWSYDFLLVLMQLAIVGFLWFIIHWQYRLSLIVGTVGYFYFYSLMPLILSACILLTTYGINEKKIHIRLNYQLFLVFVLLLLCVFIINKKYDPHERAIALGMVVMMSFISMANQITSCIDIHSNKMKGMMVVFAMCLFVLIGYAFERLNPRVQVNQLTSDDFDIWKNVRRLANEDGLIYTDLTGLDLNLHAGWNSYAGIAQRQIFIAGWYNTWLRNDTEELIKRLTVNQKVLRGEVEPDKVPHLKRYNSYYAVTSVASVPSGFTELYKNDSYVLSKYIKN